jgi:hypothetical protein
LQHQYGLRDCLDAANPAATRWKLEEVLSNKNKGCAETWSRAHLQLSTSDGDVEVSSSSLPDATPTPRDLASFNAPDLLAWIGCNTKNDIYIVEPKTLTCQNLQPHTRMSLSTLNLL